MTTETLHRFVEPRHFAVKELATHCTVCTGEYTNWQRKHNCAMCGEVVCAQCMDVRSITVPNKGAAKVSVCFACTVRCEHKYHCDTKRAAGDDQEPVNEAPAEHTYTASMALMDKREFLRVDALFHYYKGCPEHNHEKPVLTIECIAPVDAWVLDVHRHQCVACARKFSTLLRKHHCRICGEVVCKNCIQSKSALSTGTDRVNIQVCKLCFLKYYFVN
ncbi:hypothetical protein SPRG_14203 [Saprolegnia parasitica CBS 223.65]|uniref:FYVE-type domain-containing protein n=1 Tax=Saprolegnia parasitica (strain CBS 223.65) TaxID=695850 RepID=A0A067BT97_SAPPC|nr:hypothetical protein SPRG_14203 [Saprolegnia parasitica CBS 223.65]KDO20055.1 hypothetical protein SPRG_14203 [Saprolegnia parasitica CBS 223.65]|eukprot:XP_012209217.1 hypothetical protein SPRG_14203 [Saprolegnia parasitica CBS 223.65]